MSSDASHEHTGEDIDEGGDVPGDGPSTSETDDSEEGERDLADEGPDPS